MKYRSKNGVYTRVCGSCKQRKETKEFERFAKDCKQCDIESREFCAQKLNESFHGLMELGVSPFDALNDALKGGLT